MTFTPGIENFVNTLHHYSQHSDELHQAMQATRRRVALGQAYKSPLLRLPRDDDHTGLDEQSINTNQTTPTNEGIEPGIAYSVDTLRHYSQQRNELQQATQATEEGDLAKVITAPTITEDDGITGLEELSPSTSASTSLGLPICLRILPPYPSNGRILSCSLRLCLSSS